jgi:hypothetical protein
MTQAYDLYYITGFGAPPPPANNPPTANAGLDATSIIGGTATLDGSGSFDTDGTINAWAWTQVSGPNTATLTNNTSPICLASGLIAGTYTFKLTVTDDDGATGSDIVSIVVSGQAESYTISLRKASVRGKTTDYIAWNIQLFTTIPIAAYIEYASSNGGVFGTVIQINPYTITGEQPNPNVVNKKITRYYRLKIVTSTGDVLYSATQSIR